MTRGKSDPLNDLAQFAADIGPALVPAGHQELLRSITDAAMRIFEAGACSMALLTETEDELVFEVAVGRGADDVVGKRFPSSRGIAGWVVTSGQPIAIAEVQRDPRFASDVAASTGYVPRSILAMPLETDRQILGVIEVLDRNEDRREAAQDMELLAIFARQAALAIENSRVFRDLGSVFLRALASAADGDLRAALERRAEASPAPNEDLAALALHLNELGRMGPEERRAATDLIGLFLRYLHGRGRRR